MWNLAQLSDYKINFRECKIILKIQEMLITCNVGSYSHNMFGRIHEESCLLIKLGQLAKNPSIMSECNIQHTCMLDNMTNIFTDEFNSSPLFQHGPSKGDSTRI